MRRRPVARWRGAAPAVAVALGLATPNARAEPCEPARLVVEGHDPPSDWRRAIEALEAALAEQGHLWSCAGGVLRVEIGDDGRAVLRRRSERGSEASRHIEAPAELVATAEALLAVSGWPVIEPPRAIDHGTDRTMDRAIERAMDRASGSTTPFAEPRLVIDALGGARYGGTTRAVWGAGTLRVAVPIGAWSIGGWARYGAPVVLDRVLENFSMSEIGFGLSLARRFVTRPVEIAATFNPSVAVVTMRGGTEEDLAEGAATDVRLGLGASMTFPFTRMWRGVLALDGEIAPASAANARRIDPALPPLPAYSLGVALGVSAAIR